MNFREYILKKYNQSLLIAKLIFCGKFHINMELPLYRMNGWKALCVAVLWCYSCFQCQNETFNQPAEKLSYNLQNMNCARPAALPSAVIKTRRETSSFVVVLQPNLRARGFLRKKSYSEYWISWSILNNLLIFAIVFAAQFAGALGRLTSSSVNNPRQIIDIQHRDASTEEEEVSLSQSNWWSEKKSWCWLFFCFFVYSYFTLVFIQM